MLETTEFRDNAEEVIRERSNEHVFGYRTYYVGSDEKYDYYRTNQLFPQFYKTKTVGSVLYPHPYPFMGWSGERYTCEIYRGRIVVTPLKEKEKITAYYKKYVAPLCIAEYDRLTGIDADEETRLIAEQVSLKKCLLMLNDWTIKNWGQDRLNIPSLNNKKIAVDWYIIFDWSYKRPKYRSYSFSSWHEDIRFH